MGFLDALSSFFVADAYAEEPQQENEEAAADDAGDVKEEGGEQADAEAEGGEGEESSGGDEEGGEGEGEGEEEEEDEEEEEEEEEEPEDPLPKLQEQCAKTAECKPFVHEYHECAERVKKWEESDDPNKGEGEDCVEEYFEYVHCITQCAAPKLWQQLK